MSVAYRLSFCKSVALTGTGKEDLSQKPCLQTCHCPIIYPSNHVNSILQTGPQAKW